MQTSLDNPVLPKPLLGFEHINRYWDRSANAPAAKILPGECYVSAQAEMISTVLGSCVAACVRDTKLGVGGMNHFMLPVQAGERGITRHNSVNQALCYGNWAMEYLLNAIFKLGGRKERLEFKLFGGGRVLSGVTSIDVGRQNIEFIEAFLKREGYAVSAHDLGGEYPRKILYFPITGKVKMRRLRTLANPTIQHRERAYLDSIQRKPASGEAELF